MTGHWRGMVTARRLACASVLAIAIGAGLSAQASAATWIGTTHGKITRSNRWVSGGTTWHGDFWFTTGRSGAVHGQAVVGYEPTIDVSGLNNAINYIKSVAGFGLGLLGPYGGAVSAIGLGQIVGVSVSFGESMAVRRGALSGSLTGGRLTLHWTGKMQGIPYGIEFQLINGTKSIGGGTAVLHDPFLAAGDLTDGRHLVGTSESKSNGGGVSQRIGSYCVAHRVR